MLNSEMVLKTNYRVIMLSHTSKEHNPIAMVSNHCRHLTLYYDVINVMLLSDDVIYQAVLFSVVSKHLLLTLSGLCLL